MTHVFIVNENTFKYHLEYKFAGTGASDCDPVFLQNSDYQNTRRKDDGLTHPGEINLAGMVADISRVRLGDKVVFYVEGKNSMFYGFFRIASCPFYDGNNDNYLYCKLSKYLNFRVQIEPDEVYAKGVTEHIYLDVLKGISHPSEICWSLIYRKLTGNRGCTMITDYESDRLCNLIREANNSGRLIGENFTYDAIADEIKVVEDFQPYDGTRMSMDIKKRLLYRAKKTYAFEAHLQAYITQNFDKFPLNDLLGITGYENNWIGNEVICSVGEQRIDILVVKNNGTAVDIQVVELKCIIPYEDAINQMTWYVQWVCNYIVPNYQNQSISITPVILAKNIDDNDSRENFKNVCKKYDFSKFADGAKVNINDVAYIAFSIEEDEINFERIF